MNDKTFHSLGAFSDTKKNDIKLRRLLTIVLATLWRLSTNYLPPYGEEWVSLLQHTMVATRINLMRL
jgi:hypothetical protein